MGVTISPFQAMSRALMLAKRGRFTVSPNPMVGCVIVNAGRIVGEGFHQYPGQSHAETHALQHAGGAACNGTVYITLEPCCHHGHTPPCTEALIAAGIRVIYIACLDPNPLIAGKSVVILRRAGITVHVGLCGETAKRLNEVFFHYITTGYPFVILKWAMSLDGQTVTHLQDTKDISSVAAHDDAHHLRQQVDAILIGANTARQDNPALTARWSLRHHLLRPKQPLRIVLTTTIETLPLNLKIFQPGQHTAKTIIVTSQTTRNQIKHQFSPECVEIWHLPSTNTAQVHLPSLLIALGKRKITSLLIEGGMTTHRQFLATQLVNKLSVYLSPVIIGPYQKKQPVVNMMVKKIARDCHISAYLLQEEHSHV